MADLRAGDPHAQLATALLSVAQEHGCSSWRALKAEIDRRQTDVASRFFAAIADRDSEAVRALLRREPSLIHTRHARHNAGALHQAAACGDLATTRVLLDAGADPNDADDDARLGVIGWATFIPQPEAVPRDLVALLIARGARHHIFSAIATGELETVRALIEQQPESLDQRLSPRYHGQSPLHFAITRQRPDLLDLLLGMGADLDAEDANGQTALEYALLRDDGAASARLRAAGARAPKLVTTPDAHPSDFAGSIQGATVVVGAKDVAATLAWYTAIGFTEVRAIRSAPRWSSGGT